MDKNKIKFISETSFIGQTNRLVELHLEENRLKDLLNIQSIKCIEKLYLANNKISDVTDLDRMTELISMQELSLINNPVSKVFLLNLIIFKLEYCIVKRFRLQENLIIG